MKKVRFAIKKSSYPAYDNLSAGFVLPSRMQRADGYKIPTHSYSKYQPIFIPSQLSQQGITHS